MDDLKRETDTPFVLSTGTGQCFNARVNESTVKKKKSLFGRYLAGVMSSSRRVSPGMRAA